MRKLKFYDKPEWLNDEEFSIWQCGYRRGSITTGIMVFLLTVQLMMIIWNAVT